MPAADATAGPTARRLAAYALPALPLAVLTLPLYIVVPTHYAADLGLSLAAVGQVLLFVRLFDAVSDPLIGWAADRYRPRFGRRRTWFAASIPLTVLAVWMVFVPPEGAGILWLGVWAALLSLGTTASLIPYWAWGAELATSYAGRSRVVAWREGMVVAGTLIATAAPAAVQALGGSPTSGGLVALAGFVLLVLPPTALAAVLVVPEPRDYGKARLGFRDGLWHLRRNAPFLRLLAAFVLNGFANGLPATLFLFYVGQALGTPDAAGPLLFLYFLCGIAGIPLWLLLTRRLAKHRVWCGAMLMNCVVFALVPLVGPGDVWLFAAICVVTGVGLGADLVLPASMQADVIDVDTATSGEQRTGVYVAAWGLATKLALALAVGLAFPLLGAAGFDTAATTQSAGAITMLTSLYALVPVAAKLGAVALMWGYPVDAAAQAELRARIEAGRAADAVSASTSP
ncbi:MFS transporter [Methylobrevis albus]|uniref:MFS transporter n=1 Tax=Methylobrevis albus TaxID=2793297 RepID=A0A931I4I4_9HYPH|nr:MFS transporter [Methylobrevis albus]MBH0239757.1 MFS transporter [Methylobrevis albus]